MFRRSLFWGMLLFFAFISCQQDGNEDDISGHSGKLTPEYLELDSLDFYIANIDVLRADDLLKSGQRKIAKNVYDSLLQLNIEDPYLRFHLKLQQLSSSYRNLKLEEKEQELEELNRQVQFLTPLPFYLKMEYALLQGNIAFRQKDYLQVIKKLDFLQNVEVKNYGAALNKLIFDGCLRIGRANFIGFQNFYRAKDWFYRQTEMANFMPELSNRSLGILNYLLAGVSRNLNDFELGLSYCEKAKTYFENAEQYDARQNAIAISEQVVLLSKLEKHEEAALAFSKLMQISKEGDLSSDLVFTFVKNYAGVLFEQERVSDYSRALDLLQDQMNPADTSQLADVVERKAWLAELNEEDKELVNYQKKALNLYANYSEADDFDLAQYCSNLGLAFIRVGQMDSAAFYLHKGVQLTLQQDFPIDNPPKDIAFSAYRDFDLDLGPLALAIQKSLFPTNSTATNRLLAEKYYDLIFLLFEKYKTGREEGAILRDLGEFHEIFGAAVSCKYSSSKSEKEKQEEIYEIMEKGKATLLFRSIYLRAMADQYGLPDTLFQSLININQKISELDESGFEKSASTDYSNLVQEKNNILSQIGEQFPAFIAAVKSPEQIGLSQIQRTLESDQILIQYYWSSEGLFGIGVTANEVKVKRLTEIDSLEQNLDFFIKTLQTVPENASLESALAYWELAYQLDTSLLLGLLPEKGINEMIIIPDGPISGLPFEALIAQKPSPGNSSFARLPYRVRNLSISYGFSGSLFYRQNKKYRAPRKPNIQLFAYSDDALIQYEEIEEKSMELPSSSKEVDAVASVLKDYKVSKWKGPSCNKERFELVAEKSDLLHLALHGKANTGNRFGNKIIFPKNPELQDQDHILFSHELKRLNLKTKFVFLSACEAGNGKSELGEGIYSLGRGFANAGVPSMVMGLWEVNDELSVVMAERFYEDLIKGRKINMALSNAKKNYLQASMGIIAHPFYWSPLIAIGGMQNPIRN